MYGANIYYKHRGCCRKNHFILEIMKRNVIKKRGVKKLGLSWELEPLQNELFYVEQCLWE